MTGTGRAAGLQSRWYERVRQALADRRRGGQAPRAVRRILAVLLVAAAGMLALSPPAVPEGEPVLAVTRDLPIGSALGAADLRIVRVADPPEGAARDPAAVVSRVLAGPVRRGEFVTDVRLVDPGGPEPGPGRVAVPVRPADPAIVDLIGPGMHVAVILVDPAEGPPAVLAADAVVLLVAPPPEHGTADRPIVLAVPQESADQIVVAALNGTIALRFT